MKTLVVAALFLVGTFAFGFEPEVTQNQLTPEMQQSLTSRDTASSDEATPSDTYFHAYDCWAYTTCWNGAIVSCTSRGAACRSTAYPGRGVLCEAWGTYGDYRWATQTCY